MKKIGIALGGGGSRGFAHLGAIKALREKGIYPDVFSGTSAGSIAAALLAAKKTPDEIFEILKDIKLTDATNVTLPINGFAALDDLREMLDEILKGKNFSDLEHKLFVCVSNLYTGGVEYLTSGNVARAVQASSSIPILFTPVEINGQLYVDGGLIDNVPIEPLIDECDYIIAIDLMPVKIVEKVEGISDIIVRMIQISAAIQADKKEYCDVLIRLEEVADYNILDMNHNRKIFEIGYEIVKNMDISL
jgi:NTE family protein